MATPACPSYAGYRFPAEIISHAVWLYFRFPLSLRMVDELLATRGIIVSYETVRQWARKFGQVFANQTRRRLPAAGDKWHMDEVVITISGVKHWLWRAAGQAQRFLSAHYGKTAARLGVVTSQGDESENRAWTAHRATGLTISATSPI